ncbi:MAG: 4-hydroxythreonine-4-phosphate dehydrogenase PdxA [bacterium]
MSTTSKLPRIIITVGEPAGIGPDIVVQALQRDFRAHIAVVGDADVLRSRSSQLGIELTTETIVPESDPPLHQPGCVKVIDLACLRPVVAGKLDTENAAGLVHWINIATDNCSSGRYHAMVTAPVHKAVINDAGIEFSGHTEWIAERVGVSQPVMMLANDSLRVCLATTHLPLSKVPQSITAEKLEHVLSIMHDDIRRLYAIDTPVIGVCGLNPHAGEGGYLGREEIEVITPVVERLKARGMRLNGPLPADTAFTRQQLASLDAVLAMYHDQGLPVIKHQGFGEVVNVTLGLPLIRTSVDHGTALALAGSGKADPSSLVAALNLAIKFADNQISR